MQKTRFIVTFLIGALVVIFVVAYMVSGNKKQLKINTINSFEECAKAGYPILESYPRQCGLPNGKSFVENIATMECSRLEDCPTGFACINHSCLNIQK